MHDQFVRRVPEGSILQNLRNRLGGRGQETKRYLTQDATHSDHAGDFSLHAGSFSCLICADIKFAGVK